MARSFLAVNSSQGTLFFSNSTSQWNQEGETQKPPTSNNEKQKPEEVERARLAAVESRRKLEDKYLEKKAEGLISEHLSLACFV